MKRMRIFPVIFCCLLISSACTKEKNTLDAKQQYEAAMALLIDADNPEANPLLKDKARRSMLEAAENGNACAMGMMTYFYIPEYISNYRGNDTPVEEVNYKGYKEDIHGWSKKFEAALLDMAEEGNGRAMMLLSHGYNSRWDLLQLSHIAKDDSVSNMWLQRSMDIDTPEAYIWKAKRSAEPEDKRQLYKKAAALGSGYAYKAWALMEMHDPYAHFAVAELALKAEANGVHEWLEEELDVLDQQVELGNEESVRFKHIADSLDLRTRLAEVPEAPIEPAWIMFCDAKDRLMIHSNEN